jgi:hypothetical protein
MIVSALQDALGVLARQLDGPDLDGFFREAALLLGLEMDHAALDGEVGDMVFGVSS